MPITKIANDAPGNGSSATGTVASTAAQPALATLNDLLLFGISINNGGISGFTPPSGWAVLGSNQDASGTFAALIGKIADGSEQAAVNCSWTSSGHWATVGPHEFRGTLQDISSILEGTVGFQTGNSTTPVAASAAATLSATELLFAIWARVSRNALSIGPTDGFTQLTDQQSASGTASTGAGITSGYKIINANETPSSQITLGNTREWNAGMFVLKAAGGGNLTSLSVAAGLTASPGAARKLWKPEAATLADSLLLRRMKLITVPLGTTVSPSFQRKLFISENVAVTLVPVLAKARTSSKTIAIAIAGGISFVRLPKKPQAVSVMMVSADIPKVARLRAIGVSLSLNGILNRSLNRSVISTSTLSLVLSSLKSKFREQDATLSLASAETGHTKLLRSVVAPLSLAPTSMRSKLVTAGISTNLVTALSFVKQSGGIVLSAALAVSPTERFTALRIKALGAILSLSAVQTTFHYGMKALNASTALTAALRKAKLARETATLTMTPTRSVFVNGSLMLGVTFTAVSFQIRKGIERINSFVVNAPRMTFGKLTLSRRGENLLAAKMDEGAILSADLEVDELLGIEMEEPTLEEVY